MLKENNIFKYYNTKSTSNLDGYKLRIYLDEIEEFDKKLELINSILLLFKNNDIYSYISLYSDSEKLNKNLLDGLKKRKLNFILKESYKKDIEKKDNGFDFKFLNNVNIKQINLINRALIEKDFSISPVLYIDCLYFIFKSDIIIHLYDDRGIDFISKNKLELEKIYNNFGNKIKIEYLNN